MMDVVDPNDYDARTPSTPDGAAPPIVIVQRARSTWGRELLLLLLLLAATGYIVYQEYRAPWFIDRGEPRRDARVVEARHVAPVAEGSVQLRAGGATDGDGGGIEPAGSIEGPVAPEAPKPPNPAIEGPEAMPLPEGADDEAGGVAGEIPGPMAGDEGVLRAEAAPMAPDRSSTAIVWDLDRLHGPSPAPEGRAEEEPARPDAGRPAFAEAMRRREPDPPTFDQRRHFLQCLAVTLRQYGLGAGPHIDGLCRDFPAGVPVEVRRLEQRFGADALVGTSDLDWTITRLRRMGAPEPYLLDRISDRMYRTIGARHGPRSRMEARVFAARKLLEIPLERPAEARR